MAHYQVDDNSRKIAASSVSSVDIQGTKRHSADPLEVAT